MNDAAFVPVEAKPGMTALLGLDGIAPGPSSGAQDAEEDVSVAGVMLLSAMSVLMAVAGMVGFALFVTACWWLLSHVPVPGWVAALHLLGR